MRTLFLAAGNPLRRDDGVAHATVCTIPGAESRQVLQWTPECAVEFSCYDAVVFVDADAVAREVLLERLEDSMGDGGLTHECSPGQIVAMARELFGFQGQAWLCRIPARDFSTGEGLSNVAFVAARDAAAALKRFVVA